MYDAFSIERILLVVEGNWMLPRFSLQNNLECIDVDTNDDDSKVEVKFSRPPFLKP